MIAAFEVPLEIFKKLVASGNIKELELKATIICTNGTDHVPLEDILDLTPNIARLHLTHAGQEQMNTKVKINYIIIISSNLERICLGGLSEKFPFEQFLSIVLSSKPKMIIDLTIAKGVQTDNRINDWIDKYLLCNNDSCPPKFITNYGQVEKNDLWKWISFEKHTVKE
uniref:Uncharacterized protein n=1 Tax=Panagrolaimus sp. ES5 TaxID=591445 RepID=A0AC34GII9_9BILA